MVLRVPPFSWEHLQNLNHPGNECDITFLKVCDHRYLGHKALQTPPHCDMERGIGARKLLEHLEVFVLCFFVRHQNQGMTSLQQTLKPQPCFEIFFDYYPSYFSI